MRRDGPRTRRRAAAAALVAALLALGASAVYRAAYAPRPRTDLPVFLAAAERVRAGEEPVGAESSNRWRYYYPPTLATLLVPLTALPLGVAAGLWFAIGAVALVVGAVAARRAVAVAAEHEHEPGGLDRWDALALALVALPASSALLRGQLGPVLLLLGAGAILAAARGRDVSAGLLLALGAALKVVPAALVAALVVRGRWRAVLAFAAGLVLWLVVLPAPRLGLEGAARSTHRALGVIVGLGADPARLPVAEADPHIATNQALASQVIRRVPPGAARTALLLALAAGTVGVALVSAWRGRLVEALALLLAAPLLAAPIAWHHHHVVLLPALLLLAARARAGGRAARGALAAFAALSLAHFALSRADQVGLLGLGTLAVFVVLALDGPRGVPSRP